MIATTSSSPTCQKCRYGKDRRCDGLDSLPDLGVEHAIGCSDAERQNSYLDNLALYATPTASSPPLPSLPAFIPVLARTLPRQLSLPASRLYGVSWTTVVKQSGAPRYESAGDLRRSVGLRDRGRLCLIGTAHDERLENAWAESEANDLWQGLAALSFEFATSTTFSVWKRQQRFDQIYNQDRNFYSSDRFADLEVPTAPFVFCAQAADQRAALAWLDKHPRVDLIAVLAQYHRSARAFERLLEGMDALADASGRPLQFLVVGAATLAKMERLFAEFPSATVASTKPVMKAICGHATTKDLEHKRVSKGRVDRATLIQRNIKRFTDEGKRLRRLGGGRRSPQGDRTASGANPPAAA